MPSTHHNVYVIELLPSVMSDRRFRYVNRDCNPSLPCYYVGLTGLTPEERFRNHQNNHRSSYFAHRYGVRLVPELYEQYNPMTYKDAVRNEMELAAELMSRGHGVWQN